MTALVYFVAPMPRAPHLADRHSGELRYSLRSVAANLTGLDAVHVFGGGAPWFSSAVTQHRIAQPRTKHVNTWALWLEIAAAWRGGELPDEFLLMNDDFFCMRPTVEVKPTASGTCDEWTAARRFGGANATAAVMERTVKWLDEGGCRNPLSYELHMPLPVRGKRFSEILSWLAPRVASHGRIAKRSAYANLEDAVYRNATAHMDRDVKVREGTDPVPDAAWISTSDEAFRYSTRGRVGGVIRAAFPTPCIFER